MIVLIDEVLRRFVVAMLAVTGLLMAPHSIAADVAPVSTALSRVADASPAAAGEQAKAALVLLRANRLDDVLRLYRTNAPTAMNNQDKYYLALAYYGMGMELRAQGDFANAVGRFTEALDTHSGFAGAYLARAYVLANHFAQYGDAAKDLLHVLAIDPYDTKALLLLGQCFIYMGRCDAAIDVFGRARAIDADLDRIEVRIAEALVHCRQYRAALPHIQAALQKYPSDCWATYFAVVCHLALDDLAAARRIADQLTDCATIVPGMPYSLAELNAREGNAAEAMRHLRACAEGVGRERARADLAKGELDKYLSSSEEYRSFSFGIRGKEK